MSGSRGIASGVSVDGIPRFTSFYLAIERGRQARSRGEGLVARKCTQTHCTHKHRLRSNLEDHRRQVGAVFVRNYPKISSEFSLIKAHLIF